MLVGKYFVLFGIFFLIFFSNQNCRHAMVRYAQSPPEACKIYPSSKECKRALDAQTANQELQGEVHKLPFTYYFFGLLPRNVVVDAGKYCPSGPKTVHQYTSFWDGFWEQLTLAIYSPQTLEIECYR